MTNDIVVVRDVVSNPQAVSPEFFSVPPFVNPQPTIQDILAEIDHQLDCVQEIREEVEEIEAEIDRILVTYPDSTVSVI